jgi:hypothetical protein
MGTMSAAWPLIIISYAAALVAIATKINFIVHEPYMVSPLSRSFVPADPQCALTTVVILG